VGLGFNFLFSVWLQLSTTLHNFIASKLSKNAEVSLLCRGTIYRARLSFCDRVPRTPSLRVGPGFDSLFSLSPHVAPGLSRCSFFSRSSSRRGAALLRLFFAFESHLIWDCFRTLLQLNPSRNRCGLGRPHSCGIGHDNFISNRES
jgi:hypothetical protein